ncbi:Na+/H+ antiporter NhaA [Rhizobium sp. CF142]|uniref:Na+/H+ antiporter NhaA n=1 Tax=Rhizobium sp. CF142 TaxID=1144314 RepID=UPI0012F6898E
MVLDPTQPRNAHITEADERNRVVFGIGFTISPFIALLAFNDLVGQDQVKIGMLLGSIISASWARPCSSNDR